jgi:Fe-S-cluster-containing hydrogenase component 2
MITVDLSKCTGCRRCETACAFFHTGRVNPWKARIKVLNLYETGIDFPIVCVQCKERYCMRCPANAMTISPFGQVIVSPTLCTLCGACEQTCPIGAIETFQDFVYVCDLCGGNPKCVEVCTEGALIWKTEESESISLKGFHKDTIKMNPAQKRYFYAQAQGSDLREKWKKDHA